MGPLHFSAFSGFLRRGQQNIGVPCKAPGFLPSHPGAATWGWEPGLFSNSREASLCTRSCSHSYSLGELNHCHDFKTLFILMDLNFILGESSLYIVHSQVQWPTLQLWCLRGSWCFMCLKQSSFPSRPFTAPGLWSRCWYLHPPSCSEVWGALSVLPFISLLALPNRIHPHTDHVSVSQVNLESFSSSLLP